MIRPTIGRVVWYQGGEVSPLAAIICRVWSDRMVNLMVIGEDGMPSPRTRVLLVQEGGVPLSGYYCEWMPYQKGQAAKTEALEAAFEATVPAHIDP